MAQDGYWEIKIPKPFGRNATGTFTFLGNTMHEWAIIFLGFILLYALLAVFFIILYSVYKTILPDSETAGDIVPSKWMNFTLIPLNHTTTE